MTQPPSDQPGSTAPGKTGPASLSGEGISLLQPGRQLGGYRIEKLLGRGGMAAVYLATQVSLNRPVALKVLDPRLSHDASFIQRFEKESGALAALNHPKIVNIIDRGRGGLYFFVMEFVTAEPYERSWRRGEAGGFPAEHQGIREALTYGTKREHAPRYQAANILVSRNDG
jgi:serine/threonine protein kinase